MSKEDSLQREGLRSCSSEDMTDSDDSHAPMPGIFNQDAQEITQTQDTQQEVFECGDYVKQLAGHVESATKHLKQAMAHLDLLAVSKAQGTGFFEKLLAWLKANGKEGTKRAIATEEGALTGPYAPLVLIEIILDSEIPHTGLTRVPAGIKADLLAAALTKATKATHSPEKVLPVLKEACGSLCSHAASKKLRTWKDADAHTENDMCSNCEPAYLEVKAKHLDRE
jgi:hypothetical protein